jgi:hypothetical protein
LCCRTASDPLDENDEESAADRNEFPGQNQETAYDQADVAALAATATLDRKEWNGMERD